MARTFVDTNVFVYAIDGGEPEKAAIARERLAAINPDEVVISAQVMAEFYAVATTKLEQPLGAAEARQALAGMSKLNVVDVSPDLVVRAAELSEQLQLSSWDAAIVAAAAGASCRELLTEDLAAGRELGGVLVVNPFDGEPAD